MYIIVDLFHILPRFTRLGWHYRFKGVSSEVMCWRKKLKALKLINVSKCMVHFSVSEYYNCYITMTQYGQTLLSAAFSRYLSSLIKWPFGAISAVLYYMWHYLEYLTRSSLCSLVFINLSRLDVQEVISSFLFPLVQRQN